MIRHRYRRIVLFFARILLNIAVWDIIFPRIGLRSLSQRTRPGRLKRSAAAFRGLAIQMGGVLIKVGQFLSTRVDVLPKEFTDELAGLQDEVPPVSYADIRRAAEREYKVPLEEKFSFFDTEPLAAASLGQVHRAYIKFESDEGVQNTSNPAILDVVVKIQRPNIEAIIATDLAALRTVGNWLQKYRPISRRANVPGLLEEFTRILYEEIDYLAEGRNAETFAANFKAVSSVRVPKVIWTHTTKRALVLENVLAIKITDYEAITAAGVDRKAVASLLLDTYLKQIFEDGFFHADPHPGNLFVQPCGTEGYISQEQQAWQLTFVDFGMVGRVPAHTKDGLREMLIGVGTQDSARVVHSYEKLGVLLPGADLELLEKAEARVFEQFWGKNMSELQDVSMREIQEFTREFRELIYSMPFQVPQDFIFLARAVGILSGMCTGLDPEFNVWDHLAPYARKLIAEEVRDGREVWVDEIKQLARAALSVPVRMEASLGKLERGEIAVRAPDVVREVQHLKNAARQLTTSIVFAAFLLGGIQFYLAGELIGAGVLLGLSVLSFIVLLIQGWN